VTKVVGALVVAAALGWHSSPARLGVSASEFHLVLSRASVKAGAVEIELQNDGEDPHDLRLRRVGGTHTYSIPLTKPGKRRSITIRMRPGWYRLWCSVASHRALGMQAVLRVRR
jgi:uncharacterized cupredoxin-like copper-binding protein